MFAWALRLVGGNQIILFVIVGLVTALVLSWGGASAAVWYLDGKIDDKDKEVQSAQRKISRLGAEKAQSLAAAQACNKSVEDLEKKNKDRHTAIAQAKEDAEIENARLSKEIRSILMRPRPEGMSICENADKELNDEIDSRTTITPAAR